MKILYQFAEYIRGTKILKTYEELLDTQHFNLEQLQEYQLAKLKRLLIHCRDNVPFYKEYFKKNNISINDFRTIEDIKILPVMSKEKIRELFKEKLILADNYKSFNPVKQSTSGSSGIPLQFFIGVDSRNFGGAGLYRQYNWFDFNLGDKVAIFWGDIKVDGLIKKILEGLKARLTNHKYYSSFQLDDKKLSEYHEDIINFNPKLIRGYSYPIYLLAKFQKDNKIKNKISVNAVSITGEPITDEQKTVIKQEFNTEIFDQYGCGEIPMLAAECKDHNGLHITEEHVYFESIDDELIITDLDNYSMPFIRYKNGDRGTIKINKCSCGMVHRKIEKLLGRVDDTIITSDGKIINSIFFPIMFGKIEGVDAFQVVYDNDILDINLIKNKKFSSSNINYINEKLLMTFGKNQEFTINYVEKINQSKSGKTKFIINKNNQKG